MRILKKIVNYLHAALPFAAVVIICVLLPETPVYAERGDEDRTQRTSRTDKKAGGQRQSNRAGKSEIDLVTQVKEELDALNITPPRRSITDIRAFLGEPAEPRADCNKRQFWRRKHIARAKEVSRQISRKKGRELSHASVLVMRYGATAFSVGDFRDALDMMETALRSLPKHHATQRARIQATLGQLYYRAGELGKARRSGHAAVRSMYKADSGGTRYSEYQHGKTFIAAGRATVALAKGEIREAELRLRELLAVAGWGSEESAIDLGSFTSQLVANLTRQGRLAEAELEARKALRTPYLGGDVTATSQIAQIATQLASVLREQGRLEDAEYVARMAVNKYETACALPESLALAEARRVLMQVLAAQGDWGGVLEQVETTRTAQHQEPAVFERLFGSDPEVGLALVYAGRTSEGLRFLQKRLSKAESAHGRKSFAAAEARGAVAVGLWKSGDRAGALAAFKAALPQITVGRIESSGDAYQTTRISRTRQFMDAYLAFLSELHDEGASAVAGVDVADELLRASQVAQLGAVQRALSAAAARAATTNPELSELVRTEQDAGQQIAAILEVLNYLVMAPSTQLDPVAVTRLRTRGEALRQTRKRLRAEIDKRFPQYAELIRPKPIGMAEVRASLRPDEALVAFHVTDDKTFVWAIPNVGPMAFTSVSLGRVALSEQVSQLRQALNPQGVTSAADIPAFDTEAAHRLYRELLGPVSAGWRSAKHLWVVAHGPLGQLPLSLLVREPVTQLAENAQLLFSEYRGVAWLARTHAVTVLPSTTAIRTLGRSVKPAAAREPFVGFGDPWFNPTHKAQGAGDGAGTRGGLRLALRAVPRTREVDSAALAELPRLPETAEELRSIARTLQADPARSVYLGLSATEQQVKSMDLSRHRVIAFATHGLVPGDLDGLYQPALALSAPTVAGGKGDGLLGLDEILNLRLNADWAVLSACNTGAADGQGAEAVSGLGRAFFYAGAHALLVSNWPVHSEATKALTTELFDLHVRHSGISRSEALRRTRLAMIERGVYRDSNGRELLAYAHPIFWAPFTIVGNGR